MELFLDANILPYPLETASSRILYSTAKLFSRSGISIRYFLIFFFRNPNLYIIRKNKHFSIGIYVQYGGVIGAFNCQGAGWDPKEQRIKGHPECYKPMSTTVHVSDVEWDQKPEAAPMGNFTEYIVYLNQAEQILHTTPKSEPLKVTIQPSTFEIFSFIPLRKLNSNIKFAPIGLKNMFNSSGTIQHLKYNENGVELKVKGGGNFIAYSSASPKKCISNGVEVEFEWDDSDGQLSFDLPWIEEAKGVSNVEILF